MKLSVRGGNNSRCINIRQSARKIRPCVSGISIQYIPRNMHTGFCFAVLCCGYTLTDFPISIRLTSLALWQSNDCPSASKATLMNTDKYFMWIHYERLHNHNKAKHNKTVCIFLGIYCICCSVLVTTSVLIYILGMSSSCCLMCVHWLQLYDNPQPERRGEAFPAEWSRSSRCFCASASETKLLQGSVCCKLEQLTCIV